MSRGINKVILVGSVGKDPETKYTPEKTAVTNFSMAISESWKDKKTGEKKESTEWISITMFGNLAEITSEYVKKGYLVYVEGKLKTDKWKDKETGLDRYKTSVIANTMQIVDSKKDKEDDKPRGSGQENIQEDLKDDDIPF